MVHWESNSILSLLPQGQESAIDLNTEEILYFRRDDNSYHIVEEGRLVPLVYEWPYDDNFQYFGQSISTLKDKKTTLQRICNIENSKKISFKLNTGELERNFYVCQGCWERFYFENNFVKHITRNVFCLILECEYCLRKLIFVNTCTLRLHLFFHEHHKSHDRTSIIMKITASTSSTMVAFPHIDRRSREGRHKCNECGNFFPILENHLLNKYTPNVNLKCRLCSFVLPSYCSFVYHIRQHMKMPPFCCPDCGRNFRTYINLEAHMNHVCFHNFKSIKPYCKLCGIIFQSKKDLGGHMVSEHCEITYKCIFCSQYFNSVSLSISHKRQAHNNLQDGISTFYKCSYTDICSRSIFSKKCFSAHLRSHLKNYASAVYVYLCDVCSFVTIDKTQIKMHKKKGHPKTNRLKSVVRNKTYSSVVGASKKKRSKISPDNYEETIRKYPCLEYGCNFHSDLESDEEFSKYVKNKYSSKRTTKFTTSSSQVKPNKESVTASTVSNEKQEVFVKRDHSSDNLTEQKLLNSDVEVGREREKVNNQPVISCTYTGMYKCLLCNSFMEFWEDVENHFSVVHPKHDNDYITNNIVVTRVKIEKRILLASETVLPSPLKVEVESLDKEDIESVSIERTIKVEDIKTEKTIETCTQSIGSKSGDIKQETPSPKKRKQEKKKKKKTSKKKKYETKPVENDFSQFTLFQPENCLKCQFCGHVAPEIHAFRAHVMIHRPNKDAFQCLECGTSFATARTLAMHLTSAHDITNTSEYISNYNVCPKLRMQKLEPNQCSVCKEIFEHEESLKKHIRCHGMAFLSTIKQI